MNLNLPDADHDVQAEFNRILGNLVNMPPKPHSEEKHPREPKTGEKPRE